MPHEAAGLGIGPPPALALDYGESQRRIWTRRRVSEARRSTSAGSSRGRTILSWRRVCDDWVARLDRALARESRARCGRLRGSGCRARFASARARLRGCGLFPVRDRWGIGRAWVCWGCVDVDFAACSRARRVVKFRQSTHAHTVAQSVTAPPGSADGGRCCGGCATAMYQIAPRNRNGDYGAKRMSRPSWHPGDRQAVRCVSNDGAERRACLNEKGKAPPRRGFLNRDRKHGVQSVSP
jgi:hypothetical protein